MARITVEDCIDKVENQYDLVLLAKERTSQLNSGSEISVERDNDKHTVVSLREIASGKLNKSFSGPTPKRESEEGKFSNRFFFL